jgi:hypothetical protein
VGEGINDVSITASGDVIDRGRGEGAGSRFLESDNSY